MNSDADLKLLGLENWFRELGWVDKSGRRTIDNFPPWRYGESIACAE